MNKLEQAARPALVALEDVMAKYLEISYWYNEFIKHNTTAEQVEPSQLADATLEPVAWAEIKDSAPMTWMWNPKFVEKNKNAKVVLYAAPLAQQDTHATHVVRTKDPCNPLQDLTDDEILEAVGITDPQGCIKHSEFIGDARAVIAADREKNK